MMKFCFYLVPVLPGSQRNTQVCINRTFISDLVSVVLLLEDRLTDSHLPAFKNRFPRTSMCRDTFYHNIQKQSIDFEETELNPL